MHTLSIGEIMKTISLKWLICSVLIMATMVPAYATQATEQDSVSSNPGYKRSAVHVNIGVFNLVDDRFDYIYQQKSVGNIGISLETHMTDHFIGIARFRTFEMENSAELFEFKEGVHAGAGFEVTWSEIAF
ncbi:MAG TPA: hypothetical protein ENH10_08490, partial [Bacteroidetes bacterium]|nr:hypothetical protein [Bacteroidota bacterium]HEX05173.1 hypothetical protein [Bacteroidota bacterium]